MLFPSIHPFSFVLFATLSLATASTGGNGDCSDITNSITENVSSEVAPSVELPVCPWDTHEEEELMAFHLGTVITKSMTTKNSEFIRANEVRDFLKAFRESDITEELELRMYLEDAFDMDSLLEEKFIKSERLIEVRRIFARHAKRPLSMLSFDVALLLRTSVCIEEYKTHRPKLELCPFMFSLIHHPRLKPLLNEKLHALLGRLSRMRDSSESSSIKIDLTFMSLLLSLGEKFPFYSSMLRYSMNRHFEGKAKYSLNHNGSLVLTKRLLSGENVEDELKSLEGLDENKVDGFIEKYNTIQQKHSLSIPYFCPQAISIESNPKFSLRFSKNTFYLDAVDKEGSLHWHSKEFKFIPYESISDMLPRDKKAEVERRVLILSRFMPPTCLTEELLKVLKSGRIEEGLASIPDWKYFAMAYGITVLEFRVHQVHNNIPSLQKMAIRKIFESCPHKLVGSILVGYWNENNNEELLAYSLGFTLANFMRCSNSDIINYSKFKSSLKSLFDPQSDWQKEELRKYLNIAFDMKTLLMGSGFSSHILKVRQSFAKSAKVPFSMLPVDVAILIRTSRCIQKFDNYFPQVDLYPHMLSLLYHPILKDLLRMELAIVMKRLEKQHDASALNCDKTDMLLMNLIPNLDDPHYKTILQNMVQPSFSAKVDYDQCPNMPLLVVNRMLFGVRDEKGEKGPNALELSTSPTRLRYFRMAYDDYHSDVLSMKLHWFSSNTIRFNLEDSVARFIFPESSYCLDSVDRGNVLIWQSDDFEHEFYRTIADIEPVTGWDREHRVIVMCMFKPPQSLARQLRNVLRSGRIEEGLAQIPDWKYFALAYDIAVFEFNTCMYLERF